MPSKIYTLVVLISQFIHINSSISNIFSLAGLLSIYVCVYIQNDSQINPLCLLLFSFIKNSISITVFIAVVDAKGAN